MHYWKNPDKGLATMPWVTWKCRSLSQIAAQQLVRQDSVGRHFCISFMLGKGAPLTLCFKAAMNPEAVSTNLPVQGLLLLPWIPQRRETLGCVVRICSMALWTSSPSRPQKKLDLCWMYLTSCRRVGSYTTKTLSFLTMITAVRRSVFTSIILCAPALCVATVSCCCFLLEYCNS